MSGTGQLPDSRLVTLYRTWSQGGSRLLITGNVMVHDAAMTGPGGVVLDGAVAKLGEYEERREIVTAMGIFSGRHFPRDIILWAVRWYCR